MNKWIKRITKVMAVGFSYTAMMLISILFLLGFLTGGSVTISLNNYGEMFLEGIILIFAWFSICYQFTHAELKEATTKKDKMYSVISTASLHFSFIFMVMIITVFLINN